MTTTPTVASPTPPLDGGVPHAAPLPAPPSLGEFSDRELLERLVHDVDAMAAQLAPALEMLERYQPLLEVAEQRMTGPAFWSRRRKGGPDHGQGTSTEA